MITLKSLNTPCLFNSALHSSNRVWAREASKKAAGGGNKNPKQAPGNRKGIKFLDGRIVHENDVIVAKQGALWFHPGLNVKITPARFNTNLVAMKTGRVRFTCENPDLNWDKDLVKKYYPGHNEKVVIFKKYIHVVTEPQHTRFKHVQSI